MMLSAPDLERAVRRAEARIRPFIRETPLEHAPLLSRRTGAQVYLKLENLQHTGSFKIRGALNKILSLSPERQEAGIVAASTGNHGIAVAYALHVLGLRGTVYVPEHSAPNKLERIRSLGVEVRAYGQDCVDTEVYARSVAARGGMTYVSPYNDPEVVAGQGTLGLEIGRGLDAVDAVFVAVGGGGLISGAGGYLKATRGAVSLVGCSPERSAVMAESVAAGRNVPDASQPTLSDATAGGLEPGAITFDYCRALVDAFVLVPEDEIREALLLAIEAHHLLIEGAAAVALAACLKAGETLRGKTVVVVLCGGNIGTATLRDVLCA